MRKRVDLILCLGDQEAMVAAARATRTIPIVVFEAFDPVEQGLIESYARPGRNVTGIGLVRGPDFAVKRLEYLRAIAPRQGAFAGCTAVTRACRRESTAVATTSLTASGFPPYLARQEVARFALDRRLPSAFSVVEFVHAGGLLSYRVADSETDSLTVRRVEYIDRVLRGAKPAEALGLSIPRSVPLRADGVVR